MASTYGDERWVVSRGVKRLLHPRPTPPTKWGALPCFLGCVTPTYCSRFVTHRCSWSTMRASAAFNDAGDVTPFPWRTARFSWRGDPPFLPWLAGGPPSCQLGGRPRGFAPGSIRVARHLTPGR